MMLVFEFNCFNCSVAWFWFIFWVLHVCDNLEDLVDLFRAARFRYLLHGFGKLSFDDWFAMLLTRAIMRHDVLWSWWSATFPCTIFILRSHFFALMLILIALVVTVAAATEFVSSKSWSLARTMIRTLGMRALGHSGRRILYQLLLRGCSLLLLWEHLSSLSWFQLLVILMK